MNSQILVMLEYAACIRPLEGFDSRGFLSDKQAKAS